MRLIFRGLAIILAFLILAPVHGLLVLAGRKDLVPPVFMALVGRITGLRITVLGRPLQGALLLANHISWLDIVALAGATRCIFVAHIGLANHWVIKWLCDQNDTVFITRDQRRSVPEQVAQVRAALSHRPLTIFPEATTNDGKALLPFRSSLLAAAEPLAVTAPIQPVALDYADVEDVAWVGTQTGVDNARSLLSRRGRIDLRIFFLPPLSGIQLTNRKTMAVAAQRAVEAILRPE